MPTIVVNADLIDSGKISDTVGGRRRIDEYREQMRGELENALQPSKIAKRYTIEEPSSQGDNVEFRLCPVRPADFRSTAELVLRSVATLLPTSIGRMFRYTVFTIDAHASYNARFAAFQKVGKQQGKSYHLAFERGVTTEIGEDLASWYNGIPREKVKIKVTGETMSGIWVYLFCKRDETIPVPSWPNPPEAQGLDTFAFVDRSLTQVSYLKLWPPIDVTERDPPQFCTIRPEQFRIPPPPDMDAIFHNLVVTKDGLQPHTDQFRQRLSEYSFRVRAGGFADQEEYNIRTDSREHAVFSHLVNDTRTFQAARRQAFEDYLTTSKGFHHNGKFLAAYRWIETRESHTENPSLQIELQLTDYYTYRVIGGLRQLLGESFWPCSAPNAGPHLSEYLAGHFQRNIHLGIGLDMIVNTLRDNRIIITRRSANTGNQSGEAGKYFESVCEGLNDRDLDPNYSNKLQRLPEIMRRSLNEELIGNDNCGLDLLNNRIRHRFITGAMLYFPNMSINLCGAISIDCTADDIRRTFPFARDSHFESWIINETQWDERYGLPEYSPQGINRFIKETVANRSIADVWDEGSLVTLMLSTLATPQMR